MAVKKKNKVEVKSKSVKKAATKKATEGKSKKATKAVVVNPPCEETNTKKTATRNISIGMPVNEKTLKELKEKARKLDK